MSFRMKRPKIFDGYPMEWSGKDNCYVCPLREWQGSGLCLAKVREGGYRRGTYPSHTHSIEINKEYDRLTGANKVDIPTLVKERGVIIEVESGGEEERPTERAKFVATEEQLEEAKTVEMRTIAYRTPTGEEGTVSGYMLEAVDLTPPKPASQAPKRDQFGRFINTGGTKGKSNKKKKLTSSISAPLPIRQSTRIRESQDEPPSSRQSRINSLDAGRVTRNWATARLRRSCDESGMSKRRRELVLEENSETSTDDAQEPSTSIATQKKIVRQFKNTKISLINEIRENMEEGLSSSCTSTTASPAHSSTSSSAVHSSVEDMVIQMQMPFIPFEAPTTTAQITPDFLNKNIAVPPLIGCIQCAAEKLISDLSQKEQLTGAEAKQLKQYEKMLRDLPRPPPDMYQPPF